ncbi:hypothetical protein [Lentibacillus salicampi]|uniref:Uncharacterized protein n=1 Tax=Lentibacillus salicampi TaxID=175306 RepID=A0A4Y9AFE8_9BACI|nr:hypothetical protein [Lentibacillus salicampi]TFJ94543.1 hypothetical protein E4U82_01105 [Lentibacillus salicampi]
MAIADKELHVVKKFILFNLYKEKTCRNISAGPFVFLSENKKAKGEEKPEEELMGKCKSSPSF